MSEVYIFSAIEEENDYGTFGLAGALTPSECIFKEVANGESSLSLTHPIDKGGRYKAFEVERIISAKVPVRNCPEVYEGYVISVIWKYVVKPQDQLSSVNQRKLYKKATGSKSKATMNSGDEVTVVQKPDGGERWRAQTPYGEGWVIPEALDYVSEYVVDPSDPQTFKDLTTYWTLRYQLFRIYKVDKTLTEVKVEARHITYDLLYNITTFHTDIAVHLATTVKRILQYCYLPHSFEALSNSIDEHAELDFENMNPIEAYLDTEKGVCALYDCAVIRDNYTFYFLHDPGVNRGVRIEYAANMTSIDYEADFDDIYNNIIPVGETEDGKPLYLVDGEESGDAEQHVIPPGRVVTIGDYVAYKASQGIIINPPTYAVDRLYYLKCENCKVGEEEPGKGKVTKEVARARMLAQTYKKFDEKCYEPKISMKIEMSETFLSSVSLTLATSLGKCFLFDYVTVIHKDLGINQLVRVTGIEWDCLLDKSKSIEIGDHRDTLADLIKKVGGSK